MSNKILKTLLVLAVAFSFVLAACGPAATEEPMAEPTEEPMAEPTEAPMPEPTEEPMTLEVDPTGQSVDFWHVWGEDLPFETMTAIVDDFNASNEWGITVNAIDQGHYSDLENAFNAAIQSGDLPDLVTGYSNTMANWYMVDAVIDLSQLTDDSMFGLTSEDTSAIFEGSINGGKAPDGTFFAFPISQSANVLYYNSDWAKELGFDNPPSNFAEFKEQSCAAAEANNSDDNPDNDGTGGFVISPNAEVEASFIFASGGDIKNADEGTYDFTNQTVVDVAEFMKDLLDSGCAYQTETYPNPEFATRRALFVSSSTAGLPYQLSAFEAEDAIKDAWTMVPFPGKDGGQSVDLYGQYVAITNTNPERELATWIFVKYLTSPEVQAQWIEGSNYYPTRSDTTPLLEDYISNNPIWSTGLSFMQDGKAEPAWPSWYPVRGALRDTFTAILQGTPEEIPSLLEALDAEAQQLIEETQ
jgi:multiple sugar transport system substrate-binding protein/sn-glycerol 3-phosphate transport system substrate-binding protein